MWRQLFESLVLRSWWMLLFVGVCFALYARGMEKKKKTLFELKDRFCALEKERSAAQDEKEELLLRIRSQSDPEWIQMLLMKELGVVPEGQVKVYFKKDTD